MNKCYVVISVCFELLWGYLDKREHKRIKMLLKDKSHGKKAVKWLLNTLNSYKVPATWATVGGLFLEKDEIFQLLERKGIICNPLFLDCLHGKDIVEEILSSCIGHELGYHTLTHTVLAGCPYDVAKFEVGEGVRIAKRKFGVKMKSFVFPRNKVSHLNILKRYGFKVFRGENVWNVKRFFGWISTEKVDVVDFDGIYGLPTSMLFDNPYPSPLLTAVKGLSKGRGRVFHISLHPESFIEYGLTLKYQFELFLKYISKRRSEGLIEVVTMNKVGECYEDS